MEEREYALQRGGAKRLKLRWSSGWKDLEISLDGVARKLAPTAVEAGTSVALPDGSSLVVRTRRRWWSLFRRHEVHLHRNGEPVPGSDADPRVIGALAGNALVALVVLRFLFLGLWQVFSLHEGTGGSGITLSGMAFLAEGILLLAAGVLPRFGLRLPLLLGAALLAGELVFMEARSPRHAPPLVVILWALVILGAVRGWWRMRPLRPAGTERV
jgi:hypothetical protein